MLLLVKETSLKETFTFVSQSEKVKAVMSQFSQFPLTVSKSFTSAKRDILMGGVTEEIKRFSQHHGGRHPLNIWNIRLADPHSGGSALR